MASTALLAAAALLPAPAAAPPPPDVQLAPRRVSAAARAPSARVDTSAARADIAALAAALRTSGVDGPTQTSYLGSAWGLLRQSTRLGGGIGRELRAVLASAGTIARRTGLDAARARAVFLEIETNRSYAATRGDLPAVGARRRIDGITYQRYAGQALRIMPLATFGDINAEGAAHSPSFLPDLDAALSLAAPRDGALELEYLFPWGGGAPPWRSAMASATAMTAALRGYAALGGAATPEAQPYVAAAFGLYTDIRRLRDVDPADGGVWYRLYSFAPSERILNADLQTTIGLGRLADATGDAAAQADFVASLGTIVRRLPLYDTGGWSRYSLTRDAPLNYHDLQTQQLRELAKRTAEPTLQAYAARFAAYRAAPPRIAAAGGPAGPFYPWPADGLLDSAELRVMLSKPGRLTLTVRDGSGAPVDRIDAGLRSSGVQRVNWRPARRPAPGAYSVDARVVDVVGLAGEAAGVAQAVVARDVTPPVVRQVVRRGRRIGWRVVDPTSPFLNVVVRADGRTRWYARRRLRGSILLPAPPRGRRPSPAAVVTLRDSSGNGVRVTVRTR